VAIAIQESDRGDLGLDASVSAIGRSVAIFDSVPDAPKNAEILVIAGSFDTRRGDRRPRQPAAACNVLKDPGSAAIALVEGILVTSSADLRPALTDLYAPGLDRTGRASSRGPGPFSMNPECPHGCPSPLRGISRNHHAEPPMRPRRAGRRN